MTLGICIQTPYCAASYTLEVRAVNYGNSGHRESAGYCCELVTTSGCTPWWCGHCECDNKFNFCLRASGTSHDGNAGNCPLGSYSTGEIGDDSFSFGATAIASGPMTFTGSVWQVSPSCSYELHSLEHNKSSYLHCSFAFKALKQPELNTVLSSYL